MVRKKLKEGNHCGCNGESSASGFSAAAGPEKRLHDSDASRWTVAWLRAVRCSPTLAHRRLSMQSRRSRVYPTTFDGCVKFCTVYKFHGEAVDDRNNLKSPEKELEPSIGAVVHHDWVVKGRDHPKIFW
ncbi:hypothetical protein AXG93_773s1670 [Marchantia polymorpha subsp. ruderalis]|uniref:Uncharacterized protein n=1 Tax=Marchantia polymorpha subsp. ruderalis TaxID=1480154 RepID=A0A176WA13_MARPO|nr:hypothetical protein AXG93_773s1670 [Marchantia polymorpha subsp. ruderalis]